MSALLTEEDRQRLLQERLLRAGNARPDAQTIPRRPDGAAPVLTPLQRQLWFLHQLEPDSAAYSIPVAYRLAGAIDTAALADAVSRLGARHEILRTRYPAGDGEPVPEILADAPALEIRNATAADAAAALAAEVARPFDLARQAPMRAILWRVSSDDHLLLLNWHHIAVDGWSAGLLLDELGTLYADSASGMAPTIAEPALQFADVAAWRAARSAGHKTAIGAWRRHLDGSPSALELPTDRSRPAVREMHGRIHRFRLGQATARAVADLAALCGATPFQVIAAAIAVLHARDAGQDDVVLGTVVSQRERSAFERMPGCFVNTLAVRHRIAADGTARSLIAASRATMVGLADYMDLPFAELVDAIAPERQLDRTPIFQVLLSVNNFARRPFALPGVVTDEVPVDSHTAKFDLSWAIDDAGGDMPGSLTYDTALFDEPTIDRMTSRLGFLLRSMAAEPDVPVWDLDLLGADDRAATIACGDGGEAVAALLPDLVERFLAHADERPDAPAVRSGASGLSYAALDRASSRIANFLRARGIGEESRVAILLGRGPRMLEAILGVLKAGAAYVPIDPDYPADRVATIVADARADLMLSEGALASLAGSGAILLDRDADLARASEQRPPYRPHPRRLMYILFTSGSTGRPKGVAIEHGGYANYLAGVLARLDPPVGAQFGLVTTFAADLGTTMTFGALASGGCLHILSRECAADPLAFADYMRSERLDYAKLVPSHFDLLASVSDLADLLPRRCLILAGEGLPADLAKRIRQADPDLRLENHYGPTETTVAALTYRVGDAHGRATEPVGRPLPGVRCYVLDDAMRLVPTGVAGELFIGGAGVARGYDGRPGATAAAFVPDPFGGTAGGRLYATGDLVRMDRSGAIHFIGRRDRQVKIRGFRIEIGEIERTIADHPDVGEVRVVVRGGAGHAGDRRLVAYYVGAADLEADLALLVRARLPNYMHPAAFVALEAMPRTANGKFDEAALPDPEPAAPDETATVDDRDRSETETRIAAAWSRVLGVGAIGLHDDFFRIGGDSFKAVRAVRELGGDVRVMDLFAHPTIARLAAYLDGAGDKEGGVLHRLTPVPATRGISWVCVPFGGGSAISYLALAEHVAANGDALYAVELPGHDYARRDEPLRSFDETVSLCVDAIEAQVRGPVLLYGHCLGAAMATAIGLLLERRGHELAGVMVGGAFPAPRLPGRAFDALNRILPTDALISERSITDGLLVTGGARGDEDPKELAFLVRNMRHDGREAERYYTQMYRQPTADKLHAPLLCVVGEMDRATEFHAEEVAEWTRFAHTVSLASIARAGHFFQKHQAADLARLGGDHIRPAAPGAAGPSPIGIAAPAPTADARTLQAFLLTTLGQFVSTIGSGLSTFALGLWIYQQTHVVSDFALLAAIGLFPGILALPVAGAVADRWDRRKVMLAADATALAATSAVCALAFAGGPPVWSLYLLAAVASVTTAFRQPAYLAAITQLVPKRYLGHATGLVQIGTASGLVLSQAFGGALIAFLGLRSILALDVASFAVAIATLLAVRFPDLLFRRREEPFLIELTQGWRFIVKRRGLFGLMIFFALGNAFASVVLVLVTPIVLGFASSVTLGLVMAANGVGMLVGSLVMAMWGGAKRRMHGLVGFVALFGMSAIVLGLRPQAGFPLTGMFGIGLCTAFINGHWLALIQVKTGTELQGRVLAANQMVARSLMPLATLAAGWLVDRYFTPLLASGQLSRTVGSVIGFGSGRGAALLAILAGIGALGLTGLGLAWRPLRRLEQDLPDAVPDPDIVDKDGMQAAADARMQASIATVREAAL